ncbi:MAG: hypothetical protein ACOYMS_09855 [Terrimicrobiaceae bacterium]
MLIEPIFDVTDELPEPRETVKIFAEDGSSRIATWTGTVWWADGRQWQPVKWQRFTRWEDRT